MLSWCYLKEQKSNLQVQITSKPSMATLMRSRSLSQVIEAWRPITHMQCCRLPCLEERWNEIWLWVSVIGWEGRVKHGMKRASAFCSVSCWNLDVERYVVKYMYLQLLYSVQLRLFLQSLNCADANPCLQMGKADPGLMVWLCRTRRITQPSPLSNPSTACCRGGRVSPVTNL